MRVKKRAQSADGAGSVWTSYSDLFMTVAVVFLIMFIFSMIAAGMSKLKAAVDIQETHEMLEAKIPKEVKSKSRENLGKAAVALSEINQNRESLNESLKEIDKLAEAMKLRQTVIEDIVTQHKTTVAMLKNAEEVMANQKTKIAAYKSESHDFRQQIIQKDQSLESTTEKHESAKQKLLESTASIEDLQVKANALTKELAKAQGQLASKEMALKTTKSANTDKDREISERDQKIASLKESLHSMIGKQSDAKRRLTEVSENLKQAKGEAEKWQNSSESLTEELQGRDKEISGLSHERELAQQATGRQIADYKHQLAGLEEKFQKTKKKLATIPEERRSIARSVVRALQGEGVGAYANPNTGVITLTMDDAFYFKNASAELTEKAKQVIKSVIPVYAEGLLGNKEIGSKIESISVTGFASPRYRRKFVDPTHEDAVAYRYNMQLSTARADMIANFIVGEEIGPYEHKLNLKRLISVSGKGHMQPVLATVTDEPTERSQTCGPYDCARSRRVEISFQLNENQGINELLDSITKSL